VVSYSPRAARALSFLKRPFNDVDIFVEDTGNHNMWLALIRRILPNGLRLASVNLLGGRASVVEANYT
jgi:thiamine pyrophosphate-dependent acetolactate synthase large subunit-like protein